MTKIIVVDIGATNMRFGIVDPKQDFKLVLRAPNILTSRENIFDLRDAAIKGMRDMAAQLEEGEDYLIAVSSAGLVRPEDGSVIALSPAALPAYAELYPLRAELEKAMGRPVIMLNDGQAATFGEYYLARQKSPDLENFMFLTVSTGTGGGLVLNGTLHQGKSGKAGHLGLALIQDPQDSAKLVTIEDKTCGRFVDKDLEKARISAENIARLIASKVMELDIQEVVIGGGVALNVPGYIDMVKEYLSKLPVPIGISDLVGYYKPDKIASAKLSDDAGLIGAAMYAHDRRDMNLG